MGRKYRLLAGLHVQDVGTPESGEKGKPGYKPASKDYEKDHTFSHRDNRNNVIDSEVDLVVKFGAEKFAYMEERGVPSSLADGIKPGEVIANDPALEDQLEEGTLEEVDPDEDGEASEENLEGKSVAELRELAEKQGVNLSGKHRKDEIIAAIRTQS